MYTYLVHICTCIYTIVIMKSGIVLERYYVLLLETDTLQFSLKRNFIVHLNRGNGLSFITM